MSALRKPLIAGDSSDLTEIEYGAAVVIHQRQCVGDDKRPTTHALVHCPHAELIVGAARLLLAEEERRYDAA